MYRLFDFMLYDWYYVFFHDFFDFFLRKGLYTQNGRSNRRIRLDEMSCTNQGIECSYFRWTSRTLKNIRSFIKQSGHGKLLEKKTHLFCQQFITVYFSVKFCVLRSSREITRTTCPKIDVRLSVVKSQNGRLQN